MAFCRLGMDLIDSMLTMRGQAKYVIITVNYFSKWAEVELSMSITERKTTKFI